MMKKIILFSSLLTLTSCSSYQHGSVIHDIKQSETSFIPHRSIASSTNKCVDNFIFLKNQENPSYASLSKEYIKINDGYDFLKTNKDIMGDDARNVLSMNLEMKLDALCNKVNYEVYKTVRFKTHQIENININN